MVIRKVGIIIALSALGLLESASAQAFPVTVRVATPFAAGHILADTAFKFEELLEQHGMNVEVATSVLNEQTINPQMTSCDPNQRVADILLTGGQPIQDWAPEYFFFNGPYVIEDYAHFQRVWFSHLGDEARTLMSQNGNLLALGIVYRGFRQFTSNSAINGPADFADLLLRLPPVPDWVAVWSSLGVTPVQISLGGIYQALANGTAEASEGDLTQILSLDLFEVQSHLSLTNHLTGFGLVMANECYLDSLPPGIEQKVTWHMQQAMAWGTQSMMASEATLLGTLQAEGMTVVTPDTEAIRTAARPAIEQLFATNWTVTTWDEVLSL